jgi:hypothetical protein
MEKMDNNEEWLQVNVLLEYEQLRWSRRLLRDPRNPFQLLCGHLLLSGAVICHQTF